MGRFHYNGAVQVGIQIQPQATSVDAMRNAWRAATDVHPNGVTCTSLGNLSTAKNRLTSYALPDSGEAPQRISPVAEDGGQECPRPIPPSPTEAT